MSKKAESDVLVLLINGGFGVYIPNKFAEDYPDWDGIEKEDLDILLAGPDHSDYWEAWDSVLNSAKWTAGDGKVYALHQEDDLWAYRKPTTSQERDELADLFGYQAEWVD